MKNFLKSCLIFLSIFSLMACSYKPILDPRGRHLEVGEKQADADIEICQKEADDFFDKIKMERAGKEAVRKGVIGTFFGAIIGFLSGGNGRSALGGSLIGAGVGAAVGGLSVLGEGKVKPDEMKQRYMTRCLAQKGYSVVGWK